MTHRAEQVLDAIVTRLQASMTLGINSQNVFAHRTLSLAENQDELPAITVNSGNDSPAHDYDEMAGEIGSTLEIFTVVLLVGDDEPAVKRALYAARTEVHKAIDLNETLDLSFVLKVEYGGAEGPEIDSAGERAVGSQQSSWLVTYHMNPSDPS